MAQKECQNSHRVSRASLREGSFSVGIQSPSEEGRFSVCGGSLVWVSEPEHWEGHPYRKRLSMGVPAQGW